MAVQYRSTAAVMAVRVATAAAGLVAMAALAARQRAALAAMLPSRAMAPNWLASMSTLLAATRPAEQVEAVAMALVVTAALAATVR
jgi:hypothetical protein